MSQDDKELKALDVDLMVKFLDDYKKRNMTDPNCSWCGYGEDIVDSIIDNLPKILERK